MRLYTGLSLHCHQQNDSCINTASDESHFNVSLIGRAKVTRQCPQTTTLSEEKGKPNAESNRVPSAYQPNALPLGQTGSLTHLCPRLCIYTFTTEPEVHPAMKHGPGLAREACRLPLAGQMARTALNSNSTRRVHSKSLSGMGIASIDDTPNKRLEEN